MSILTFFLGDSITMFFYILVRWRQVTQYPKYLCSCLELMLVGRCLTVRDSIVYHWTLDNAGEPVRGVLTVVMSALRQDKLTQKSSNFFTHIRRNFHQTLARLVYVRKTRVSSAVNLLPPFTLVMLLGLAMAAAQCTLVWSDHQSGTSELPLL